MCDPITAIGVGMSMAGTAAQYAGQSHQTELYNAAAKQNAINASVAASNQYADEGRKYIYDQRQVQQEGYQAVMKGRQANATAEASAGAAGFDLSSLSVGDVLSNNNQKIAQSVDNIKTKQDDNENRYDSSTQTEEGQAQGRINSMPYKEAPSALGLAIGLGSDVVGGISGSSTGRNWFNSKFGGS